MQRFCRLRLTPFLVLACLLAAPRVQAAAPNAKAAKTPLAMKDILAWKSIRGAVLSNNGQWFAYRLAPNEGNAEVVLRQTRGKKELRFPVGSSRRGGTMFFSYDSKWFVFPVYPSKKRGSSSSRTRSSSPKMVLLEIATGKKTEFDKVRRIMMGR